MSIPTPFNPLGTLGAVKELPYIQPVMTSETTWSNEPSFGCEVSGAVSHGANWHVLSSSFDYTGWYMPTSEGVVMRFAKPLKVVRFKVTSRRTSSTSFATLKGFADGVEVSSLTVLCDKDEYVWSEENTTAPYCTEYRIYGSNTLDLYPIILDAYYKA